MSEVIHLVCDCKSADHDIRIVRNEEEVWVEVQLNSTKNLLQRLVAAIKYVFGYNSKYGHWDCTLLNKKEMTKLYYFLKKNKDN